ncbi:hypothetical protein HK096_011504 [Nowakowskiella sp. JEL0078]|nr:hypothetical protein HK096_011504 [Nowakowskiella sp. JEL0078]
MNDNSLPVGTNGNVEKAAKRANKSKKQKKLSTDALNSAPDSTTYTAKLSLQQTNFSQPTNLFPTENFTDVPPAAKITNPNLTQNIKPKSSKKHKKATTTNETKVETINSVVSSSDHSLRSKNIKTELIQMNQVAESPKENAGTHKKANEKQSKETMESPKDSADSLKKSKNRKADSSKTKDVDQNKIRENEKPQNSKSTTPSNSGTPSTPKSNDATPIKSEINITSKLKNVTPTTAISNFMVFDGDLSTSPRSKKRKHSEQSSKWNVEVIPEVVTKKLKVKELLNNEFNSSSKSKIQNGDRPSDIKKVDRIFNEKEQG